MDSDNFENDYEAIAHTIKELIEELGEPDHFIINPVDAEEAELRPHMDDLTGDTFYEVSGYKLFPNEDCPSGRLGACVKNDEESDPSEIVAKA